MWRVLAKLQLNFHKESHKLISQQAILIDIQLAPRHFREQWYINDMDIMWLCSWLCRRLS